MYFFLKGMYTISVQLWLGERRYQFNPIHVNMCPYFSWGSWRFWHTMSDGFFLNLFIYLFIFYVKIHRAWRFVICYYISAVMTKFSIWVKTVLSPFFFFFLLLFEPQIFIIENMKGIGLMLQMNKCILILLSLLLLFFNIIRLLLLFYYYILIHYHYHLLLLLSLSLCC